jgi:hypothetical protein
MLNNIKLNAGAYTELAITGRFINIVLAAGEIEARMRLRDGSTFQTKLISGMSFELPRGFVSAAFLSEISQQTKIWLSNLPLTFSPSESKIIGSSGLSSTSASLSFGSTVSLVLADATRKAVTLYSEQDFFVGGVGLNSKNAIKVKAGETTSIGTQAAIYGFTDNPVYFGKPLAEFSADSVTADSVLSTSGGGVNVKDAMAFVDSINQLFFVQNQNLNMIHGEDLSGAVTSVAQENYMVRGNSFDRANDAYIFGDGNGGDLVTVDLVTKTSTRAPLLGFPAGETLSHVQIAGDSVFSYDGNFLPYAGTISGGVSELIMPFKAYNFYLMPNGRLAIMQGTQIAVSTDSTYSAFGAETVFPVSYNSNVCITADSETGALYVAKKDRQLYKSLDYGVSWSIVAEFIGEDIGQIIALGDYVTLFTDVAVYQSTDGGNTFGYRYVNTIAGLNNMIFSGNGDLYLAGVNGGLERLSGQAKVIGGLSIAVMSEVN